MKLDKELADKIKRELEEKKSSRRVVLDQIAIVDGEISLIDKLIKKLDRKALEFIDKINPTVKPVKDAYVARVSAGCKSDLDWEEGATNSLLRFGVSVTTTTWKVVKNKSEERFVPYYGLKFYQKPVDRDYGSKVIGQFIGSVEDLKPVIAVTDPDGIPKKIEIGDIITDSLNAPEIFSLGNLPKVIGIGTTDSVGIVTSLIGGIESGSNIFYHFGAGSLVGVDIGMTLFDPVEGSGVVGEESITKIFPDKTLITGFSVEEYLIGYIDDDGILQETSIDVPAIILSKNALETLEEGEVNVGVTTNYPALFLSSNASSTRFNVNFTALRVDEDIDLDFDYTDNPNAPLKIGIVKNNSIGAGGSVFLDNSGFSTKNRSWDPNLTYDDTFLGEKSCKERTDSKWDGEKCIINPEPEVGAGSEIYYRGNEKWPTYSTRSSVEGPITIKYAKLGDTFRTTSTLSDSIGFANSPQGGFPSNCGSFNNAINQAEKVNEDAIKENAPEARKNVRMVQSLRKERENRQLYAWSLLQASSKLLEEISDGEQLVRQIDRFDFDE
jgi:hypothetical protein